MDREQQKRERLKDVHQTDLMESRVNEDFLDWLKSKGPSWLLIFLIAICVFLALQRWRSHKEEQRAEAWAALTQARLPGSFEDVAEEFSSVGQIGNAARLGAADALMHSVQIDRPVGSNPLLEQLESDGEEGEEAVDGGQPKNLTEEDRERYLQRAALRYDEVIASDDNSLGLTLYAVNAMFGKAAVAEARGDVEEAKQWYAHAADRAEAFYPGLAEQARVRLEHAEMYVTSRQFKPRDELPSRGIGPVQKQTVPLDEELRNLLMPTDETGP